MKRILIIPFLLFASVLAMASDVAVLENLGFSPDGRYFMFGEHVLVTGEGIAYAEIGVVNVAKNEFAAGGWKKNSWAVAITPNQSSRGALYELLAESEDLKKRCKISHLDQGRLLYARNNGDETGEEPVLVFRDFKSGREFELAMHQDTGSEDSGNSEKSDNKESAASFYIDMKVKDSSGIENTYTVGRKGYKRSGVKSYEIVRVWTSNDGKSLVIAVAKQLDDLSVRYMVETLILK